MPRGKNKKKQQRKGNKKVSRSYCVSSSGPSEQTCNDDSTALLRQQQQPAYWPNYLNFVHEAGVGCHIGFPQHYFRPNIDNAVERRPTESHDANTATIETTMKSGIYENEYYDWILDWEDIDDDDDESDGDMELPELQIDPNDYTLSLYNYSLEEYQIAFISIYDCKVFGRNSRSYDEPLSSSVTITSVDTTTTDDDESQDNVGISTQEHPPRVFTQERTCTTLIVLCPPRTVCHLCYLEHKDDDISYYENCIDSDIQIWKSHPNIYDMHRRTVRFPLATTTSNTRTTDDTASSISEASLLSPSYLCTQGVGGSLTHFLIGNYHAIDFACPIGTPIIAVGNGTIVQVHMMCGKEHFNSNEIVTGIAVSNLFHWNSILLRLDDSCDDLNVRNATAESVTDMPTDDNNTSAADALYIEYVHIATSVVQVGEHVREGQIIGTTGSVGFSPEPHLHLAAYRSADNFAPTCGLYFQSESDNDVCTKFIPVAGQRYNENGIVN